MLICLFILSIFFTIYSFTFYYSSLLFFFLLNISLKDSIDKMLFNYFSFISCWNQLSITCKLNNIEQHSFKYFRYLSVSFFLHIYSSNNVIADRTIVLKSSCPEGDRSCNVPDRACSQKNWFAIFTVRDRAWSCSFLFCN